MNWEQHKRAVLQLIVNTIDDSESMRRRCRQWMEDARTGLVVDCGQLERLDSSGLETLMWLQEELERGSLHADRIMEGQPETAFMVTRLVRRFQIHDTIEDARATWPAAGGRSGGMTSTHYQLWAAQTASG